MCQDNIFDEIEIKLISMTDDELVRYRVAVIEYSRNLDPNSPKYESTKKLLQKIRNEESRRLAQMPRSQMTSRHAAAEPVKKRRNGCLIAVFVALAIVVFIGAIGAALSRGSDPDDDWNQKQIVQNYPKENNNPETEVRNEQETDAPIVVDMDIGSGNYIVGVDIPAGKYDITAISGGGNVISSNAYSGGINAIMGAPEKNTNGIDMYEQEYKNITLTDGVRLSVSGVVINIYCDKASGKALIPRNQAITEEVELGNGYYVAGEDFLAGVYTITVVSGGGNVISDNAYEGGINAIMGVPEKNTDGLDMYEQEYKNIVLEEGVTLNVDGVTIMLTPSK